MKLSPDYLRTYTPEGIDEMEWENLETSDNPLDPTPRSCGKEDKIMAVFFRFGEGVARSRKEPQKLFKLLDMFESLRNSKPHIMEIFDGEAGVDICTRFRELEKLIIDASSKVFWEFGLQIEGNADGLPPPQDGSVPKLVRYAINYLKYLATVNYRTTMAKALQRNIDSKRSSCRDRILIHIFMMNTYWYMYMRTKNTELEDLREQGKESIGRLVTEKIETFFKCLDEICERHRVCYSIPDVDLREQMREATMKLVVPAYAEFLESYSGLLQRKVYPSPERLQGLLRKAFDGDADVRLKRRSSTSNDWNGGRNSASMEGDNRQSR
ncbi:Exocyst complex component Exo70 [Sesbania bispinosa]|nr:Exocyst complex component Exo70 [Sesbania bispinosa]